MTRPEDIEWYDDGLGVLSWKRGWPEMIRPGHVVLAAMLGIAGARALWWAGLGVVVAVTGAWFLTLCVLLLLSDALGRILPDRYTILATLGVTAGWAVDAIVRGDVGVLLRPLGWAALATVVFLLLMVIPMLLTRGAAEGLGAGDVKVAFPLALWLGRWGGEAVLAGLFLGTVLAGAWILVLLLARRIGRGGTIAFGPWLVAGTVLTTGALALLVAVS